MQYRWFYSVCRVPLLGLGDPVNNATQPLYRCKYVLLEIVVNYFKTVIIWSHGPSVDAAAHRSTTSCKASVLVFLTGQKKKSLQRLTFYIICPKMRVDENCKQ